MKIKQIKLIYLLALVFSCLFSPIITTSGVFADSCGGVDTSLINCDDGGNTASCADGTPITYAQAKAGMLCGDGKAPTTKTVDAEENVIWTLLLMAINVLTGGIVIAAIGGFVYSAILYSSAGGSADNIKKAKTMITNIVIGIVAYVLMYAFLNYLIPGGIFN